jgi:hypothetical protein
VKIFLPSKRLKMAEKQVLRIKILNFVAKTPPKIVYLQKNEYFCLIKRVRFSALILKRGNYVE